MVINVFDYKYYINNKSNELSFESIKAKTNIGNFHCWRFIKKYFLLKIVDFMFFTKKM